jgi:hypothetical protein
MVFVLFVEKIVYDIRVKSDFILFEGFLHSLPSLRNLPFSQNKILLLTLTYIINNYILYFVPEDVFCSKALTASTCVSA